jgi:hypothetical protein
LGANAEHDLALYLSLVAAAALTPLEPALVPATISSSLLLESFPAVAFSSERKEANIPSTIAAAGIPSNRVRRLNRSVSA